MKKKLFSICLVLAVAAGMVLPAGAASEPVSSYAEYMENIYESNGYMIEIIDYVSDEEGNLSDYYGGTCYSANGNLIVHITAEGESLKADLMQRYPNCIYETVAYSINQLSDYQDAFFAMGLSYKRATINTYTNRVSVYFETQDQLDAAAAALSAQPFADAFALFLYESDLQIINSSIETPASELFSAEEIEAYENGEAEATAAAPVSVKASSGDTDEVCELLERCLQLLCS